jgi:uncharacterized protein
MITHTVPSSTTRATAFDRRAALRWGLGLPALRVAIVAAACTAAWLLIGWASGTPAAYPVPPLVAAVAMLPVNLICLALVRRRLHREGRSVRGLIGLRPGRLGRDILWGLLWLMVLSVPFAATIMIVMALLHGESTFAAFETVFFDADSLPSLSPVVAFVLAAIAVLTFAPLNAPAEELVYRGTAQQDLARRMPVAVAIVVASIFFGLQHVWYAPTPDAVLVYACAFFVWGVGSGLIAWRQKRLLPLIVAHGLVNLFTTLPALAIPFFLSNGAST